MTGRAARLREAARAHPRDRGRRGVGAPAPAVPDWAVRVGSDASAARREGRALSPFLKMQEAVGDGLVSSKIRARLGGRLRLAVSGSAPLPRAHRRFFHAVGVPLIEGLRAHRDVAGDHGQPSAAGRASGASAASSPASSCDRRGRRDPHARPARDAGLLEPAGRHRGGDAATAGSTPATSATLSDDGYLAITDRKKELLVTSGGKKIAPQPIEALLKRHPLVAEAMVVGEAPQVPGGADRAGVRRARAAAQGRWACRRAIARGTGRRADVVVAVQRDRRAAQPRPRAVRAAEEDRACCRPSSRSRPAN